MRLVLYGKEEERLLLYRKSLLEDFERMGRQVQIDYFVNIKDLKKAMFQYDAMILTDKMANDFVHRMNIIGKKSITFSAGKVIRSCFQEDIYYIEADLKQVHVWGRNEDFILPMKISDIEKQLLSKGFIKVHRSYLVNQIHIECIVDNIMVLDNRVEVPISKYRLKEVREIYLAYRECAGN